MLLLGVSRERHLNRHFDWLLGLKLYRFTALCLELDFSRLLNRFMRLELDLFLRHGSPLRGLNKSFFIVAFLASRAEHVPANLKRRGR